MLHEVTSINPEQTRQAISRKRDKHYIFVALTGTMLFQVVMW